MSGKQITEPFSLKMCTDSACLQAAPAIFVAERTVILWIMNTGQKMSIVSVIGVPTVVSTSAAVLMPVVILSAMAFVRSADMTTAVEAPAAVMLEVEPPVITILPTIHGLAVPTTNTALTAVNTSAPAQVTAPPIPHGRAVIGMNTAMTVTS